MTPWAPDGAQKTFCNAHLVWDGSGLSGLGTEGQTESRREVAEGGEAGKEKSLAMRETHSRQRGGARKSDNS